MRAEVVVDCPMALAIEKKCICQNKSWVCSFIFKNELFPIIIFNTFSGIKTVVSTLLIGTKITKHTFKA